MVLEVGARPSGQASLATLTSRWMSALFASVEAGLPVSATSGMARRLSNGSSSVIDITLDVMCPKTHFQQVHIIRISQQDMGKLVCRQRHIRIAAGALSQ